MVSCKSVYEPKEDSALLERYVRQYAKGSVLDMGTGSGIQALAAASSNKVKDVIATDIRESIISYNKKIIKNKKITFIVSDLFEIFKKNNIRKNQRFLGRRKSKRFSSEFKNKKFDTIIFNPPYLPQELKVKDLTLEGGKKGYEVIEKFLNGVNNFLKLDGIVLIVFSSLTKKEKVNEFIRNNLLEFVLLEKQHYFFEELYAYKIVKPEMLKKLEKKNVENIKYFTKGKRGLIFTGQYKDKKVAIKIKNPESKAILRTNNEIKFLKLLNKKGIGPKLLFYGDDFLVYEFADGEFIADYLKNNKKDKIKKIIRKILNQMFIMDKMKLNKEEMSHPQKHIIIDKKNNPILIDFERVHYTIKPSNATQFTDFLIGSNILKTLENKKININKNKIIQLSKTYKKNINKNNFNNILNQIK